MANENQKTHIVLDLTYTEEEGQQDFVGTLEECNEYVKNYSDFFMFKIVPMTPQELEFHNSIK